MDKPLEIVFRNMDRSDALADAIAEKCARLERLHPHIISTHVAVETPQRRHRKGKIYHMTIKVHVPGKWLVVSHPHAGDMRHENLTAAVNDAFRAMERHLDDLYGRKRGERRRNASP
ncbi:MAG: ribosome-associated translation inhibitor RaiA [Alphaproteobacteria bacterium]|nr:HPF/RaiA family ribosome-associated protein [Alphaproteobacteria bacterium]MDE2336797.1 ribosome-associated translation inhibitor RaiA [Alphaproteobacteria bacterium]